MYFKKPMTVALTPLFSAVVGHDRSGKEGGLRCQFLNETQIFDTREVNSVEVLKQKL
jgi:hypothetical protein